MTPLRLKTVLLSLAFTSLVFCGCSQKKPVLVVPKEAPIAAGTPAPTPTPEAQAAATATPQPTPEAKPATTEQTQTTPPKKRRIPKPSPSVPKVVAEDNSKKEPPSAEAKATPGLIAPTVSAGEAARDQVAAEQLLQSTEINLNTISKRLLSADEQSVVAQIRNFMAQSRQALKDNDPSRAKNFAVKANVLSNDLNKSK